MSERKNGEIKQLREEILGYQEALQKQQSEFGLSFFIDVLISLNPMKDGLEKELMEATNELQELRVKQMGRPDAIISTDKQQIESIGLDEVNAMQRKLDASETQVQKLKRQLTQVSSDANRKHNDQQNQLQGVETVWFHSQSTHIV